jgi:uncharacterized metal-binding protein YceD (DUF177 family)
MSAEPFSYKIAVSDVAPAGRRYNVQADDEARRRLAAALAIPEISAFSAELEVKPMRGGAFAVRGSLSASIVQTDVVTLDPVAQDVTEAVDLTLVAAETARDAGRGQAAGGGEEPDTFSNGRIDLGAIMSEHLALGLDPYPRAPGTTFASYMEDDPAGDASPFAVLSGLKKPGGSPP